MLLQKQPSHWSCLPTAVAMLMDVRVEEIFKYLGHDGSELWWPKLGEKFGRRAFHAQELVNYCFSKQVAMIHVSAELISTPDGEHIQAVSNPPFGTYLKYQNGVLCGTTEEGNPHAIAYYGNKKYCPTTGDVYHGVFHARDFYILHPLKL